MSPPLLVDSAGAPVPLERELAAGGEGVVYTLRGDPSQVAKVYRQPPTARTAAKLAGMVANATDRLAAIAAWPTGLLFAPDTKRLAGFTMPRLVGFEPIQHLYNPAQRQQSFPAASWAFLVRAARNAAAAFDELHQAGVVVGDVNQSNVRVSAQALVRLIDCDSFQVTVDGQQYPCEVGVAHYTPPELQGRSLAGLVRTVNHDRFGLAVLLFQLLVVGRHPYAGVPRGGGDLDFEQAIAGFRFAYGPGAAAAGLAEPPFTPSLADLPPAFLGLFARAFERGSEADRRPSAGAWLLALGDLLDRLRSCPADAGHWHWDGARACPWCRIVAEGGPDYFLGVSEPDAVFTPDEPRWRDCRRRLDAAGVPGEPYERGHHTPAYTAPTPLPEGMVDWFGRAKELAQVVVFSLPVTTWLVCPLTSVAKGTSLVLVCLAVTGGAFVALVVLLAFGRCFREFRKRRRDLDRAEADLQARERDYQRGVGRRHARHQDQTRQAEVLLGECRRLPLACRHELDQLAGRAADLNREAHLRTLHVADADLPHVDAACLWALAMYNIYTAADLDPDALDKVPGLTFAAVRSLLAWRDREARAFRFDRGRAVPEADRRAVLGRFRRRQRDLFAQVAHLLAELEAYPPAERDEAARALDALSSAVSRWAQAAVDFRLIRTW